MGAMARLRASTPIMMSTGSVALGATAINPLGADAAQILLHHLEFGCALLHIILKPLARGSVHRSWTRSQKPSPTCRFILWSFANDLRKGGSVVLGKLEAHRELLRPVKTEALLA
jgi:hypothetical protein